MGVAASGDYSQQAMARLRPAVAFLVLVLLGLTAKVSS